MKQKNPVEFLPLSATDFQLLLSLIDGPLHGYAIGKAVKEASGGRVRIGLGSLYRIIARLLGNGLLREADSESATQDEGASRRQYRLSALGEAVLRAEVNRLSEAVEFARGSQLFVDREV